MFCGTRCFVTKSYEKVQNNPLICQISMDERSEAAALTHYSGVCSPAQPSAFNLDGLGVTGGRRWEAGSIGPVLSQTPDALGEFWCPTAKTNPKMRCELMRSTNDSISDKQSLLYMHYASHTKVLKRYHVIQFLHSCKAGTTLLFYREKIRPRGVE